MTSLIVSPEARRATGLRLIPFVIAAMLSFLLIINAATGSLSAGLRIAGLLGSSFGLLPVLTWPIILLASLAALWRFRRIRPVAGLMLAVLPLIAVQLVLRVSAGIVPSGPGTTAVSVGSTLLLQAMIVAAAGFAVQTGISTNAQQGLNSFLRSRFSRMALLATGLVFVTLISGTTITLVGAQNACASWPLCGPGLLPGTGLGWIQLGHRLLVALTAVFMLALLLQAWKGWRTDRVILTLTTTAVILFFAQGLIGAVQVLRNASLDLAILHAVTGATLWAVMVVLVVQAGLSLPFGSRPVPGVAEGGQSRWRDFLALTKPIVVLLLLLTTYGGMVVAGGQLPSISLTALTLFGGALAAGGSSAINQVIDRNRDRLMTRTARRPIAAGRLTPAEGLAFGVGLCLISFYLLAVLVNPLAAILAVLGMVYYVYLYSVILKNATVQNIVIGGGAGAIPPLVGWAAVNNSLSLAALLLFGLIFLWTPPHFWALALVKRKDYERAGVPMLPVVRGETETRRQIFIYTLVLVAFSLLLPALNLGESVYLVAAIGLGGMLSATAWRVLRGHGNKIAWKMYRYSSMYLALLFLALMIDSVIFG